MSEKISIRSSSICIWESKVLLVKSNYDDGEYYLFPGGGVESCETVQEAAIRETLEETGVEIRPLKLVHVNEFIYRDWSKRSVSVFFLAEKIGKMHDNTLNDNGKIKEVEWVEISALKNIDLRPKALKESIIKEGDRIKFDYTVDFK